MTIISEKCLRCLSVKDFLIATLIKIDKDYSIQAKDLRHFQERSDSVKHALSAALKDYKQALEKPIGMQGFNIHIPGKPVSPNGIIPKTI